MALIWYGGVFRGDVPFNVPMPDRKDRLYGRIREQKLVVEFSYDRIEEREALTEAIELWLKEAK